MRAELGAFQQTAEILDITVKVSRNQNVRSAGQLDQVADSSGSVMKSPGGLAERFQETRRIGHGPRAQPSVSSRFAFAALLPRTSTKHRDPSNRRESQRLMIENQRES